MTKQDGDSNLLKQKELDTGDLQRVQEEQKSQNMSEISEELENYTALQLLEENPSLFLSDLVDSLELLGNTGWWISIAPIRAKDGTVLARISIAPPEGFEIEILEDESLEFKRIVLNKK
jgi:hypothetical protein